MYNEKTNGYISEVRCSTSSSGYASPLMDSSKVYPTEHEAVLASLRRVYTYFNNNGAKQTILDTIKVIGHKCKHDPIFFLDNFNVHVCAEYENEPSDLPEEPTTGNPILDKQCAFKCRCVQTKNIIALEVGREYIVEEVREVKMALKSLIKSYTQCRIGQARFSADCFEILP